MKTRRAFIFLGLPLIALLLVGGAAAGIFPYGITSPSNGQVLTYNSTTSQWENQAASTSSGANPTGTISGTVGTFVNGSASTFLRSDGAPTLPATIAGLNSVTSAALSALTLGTGTFGTSVTFASATGIPTFAQGVVNFTGATTITGGAGNMVITAGTGNSRTLALQSTTSGGTATTFMTGNADQSTTFGGALSSAAGSALTLATGTSGTALTFASATNLATFTNTVDKEALGDAGGAPALWLLPTATALTSGNFAVGTFNGSLYLNATTTDVYLQVGNTTKHTFNATGATLTGTLSVGGKVSSYNGVATAGWGVPAIPGAGRTAAATGAVATVAAYTVGAADGTFEVSANVNVTTATAHNFTCTCTYTDETNTSRVLTFGFTQLTGSTFLTAITNVTGTGPYESPVFHIRCKASTAITIATTGTFTTVTYNVEGVIKQTQ